ncbi:TetR/AcrR family transcriptional regulator [Streptomyces sp. NBC_01622]|uniref:TetR/AcrR family transcriptional regulator n=1 Tax=Streptomyces sp. NBC_01622 TaxID=2975903 RepID=UPI003863B27A|nr:TetR/AcrR family transcriptional regulator [Streptomyces sp. NBC_01622]
MISRSSARAQATRARILEAALRELGRDPDCSLGDIAGAAGVARRTVYGHFTGRAALVQDLAADAGEAVRRVSAATRAPTPDAVTAPARFVLALWPVGDRYRTLLGLAHHDLGPDASDALLRPARETVIGILTQGQQQGVFHTAVPPGPLNRALEAQMPALLECVNSGLWNDDGTAAATAALIAAGVGRDSAAATVHHLRPSH